MPFGNCRLVQETPPALSPSWPQHSQANNPFLVPRAPDMQVGPIAEAFSSHVDRVGKSRLPVTICFSFFLRPQVGTSSVPHHSMKCFRVLQGVPLNHFPLDLGWIRRAQHSSAKISTSNISTLCSAFLFSFFAKGSIQGLYSRSTPQPSLHTPFEGPALG